MSKSRIALGGLQVLTLVSLAAALTAPVAQADRVRYKGWEPRVAHDRRPVIIERHSGPGPAIAGFIGGLVLGTVLSNHQDYAPPPPVVYAPPPRVVYAPPPRVVYAPAPDDDYYFYDPYDRERFESLDQCADHFGDDRDPRMIQVIDAHSGRCVDLYRWDDGGWSRWDRHDRDWRAVEEDEDGQ